jgi:DNA mismatch endonuclease (patch repair protein)
VGAPSLRCCGRHLWSAREREVVDTLTAAERSKRMSLIKGKDTAPELALRRAVHALGLRYRLHRSALPGKPDLVFPKYRSVVFVHGCFWHRHEACKVATTPKSNTAFWVEKFERNVSRDRANSLALADRGWRVLTVWECELNTPGKAAAVALEIREVIPRVVVSSLKLTKYERLCG